MKKDALAEIQVMVMCDFLTVNIAGGLFYWFRFRSGWFPYTVAPDFLVPIPALYIFWLIIFSLFGLYRRWYAKSRFDEFTAIIKTTLVGVFVVFFAVFMDDRGIGPMNSRVLIAVYWLLMVVSVGGGRFLLHTFQRRLLQAGIGLHNTLIVGWAEKAKNLFDMVEQHPALGYKVIGFVPVGAPEAAESYRGIPLVGSIVELPALIDRHNVREVLIALDSTEHDRMLDVIAACNSTPVNLKIIPDLYDIISGQARTNQIYGFPLIEIMPEIMQPWERAVKRGIDIAVSLVVLAVGMPVWIIVACAIKLDSKGPVFYTQGRVGKDGKHFRIVKFRSMDKDAEEDSGPVWAEKQDPRVTRVGRIIRNLRLDEIPQFINVLDGNMSLVGPRPERPFFVDQLSKEIPLYKRRLKVRPGITGWAQVKHKYDESIDDVRKKVEYDLYYIENMTLRMDLKILLNTIFVVLLGKGH